MKRATGTMPLIELQHALGAFAEAHERLEREYSTACEKTGHVLEPEQIGGPSNAAGEYLSVLYDRAIDLQERSVRAA